MLRHDAVRHSIMMVHGRVDIGRDGKNQGTCGYHHSGRLNKTRYEVTFFHGNFMAVDSVAVKGLGPPTAKLSVTTRDAAKGGSAKSESGTQPASAVIVAWRRRAAVLPEVSPLGARFSAL